MICLRIWNTQLRGEQSVSRHVGIAGGCAAGFRKVTQRMSDMLQLVVARITTQRHWNGTTLNGAVRKGASGRWIQDAKPLKQRAQLVRTLHWRLKKLRVVAGATLIAYIVS